VVSGNDDDLQSWIFGCDFAKESIIHPLRFCGRIWTIEHIACYQQYIYFMLFDLFFQPFQKVEMLCPTVVFIKGLA